MIENSNSVELPSRQTALFRVASKISNMGQARKIGKELKKEINSSRNTNQPIPSNSNTRFNGTVNKSGQSRLLNKLREYHGEWVQNSLALVLDKNDNELKQGNSSIYRFCKSNSIFSNYIFRNCSNFRIWTKFVEGKERD